MDWGSIRSALRAGDSEIEERRQRNVTGDAGGIRGREDTAN